MCSPRKYTFTPAKLSIERGEKEVLADNQQPTAPPSVKLRDVKCALSGERKWWPNVHQARQDERFLVVAVTPGHPNQSLCPVFRVEEARKTSACMINSSMSFV